MWKRFAPASMRRPRACSARSFSQDCARKRGSARNASSWHCLAGARDFRRDLLARSPQHADRATDHRPHPRGRGRAAAAKAAGPASLRRAPRRRRMKKGLSMPQTAHRTSFRRALTAVISAGAVAAAALAATVLPAAAEEGIFVPLFTYRQGPFANSGTPLANGMPRLPDNAQRTRRRHRRRKTDHRGMRDRVRPGQGCRLLRRSTHAQSRDDQPVVDADDGEDHSTRRQGPDLPFCRWRMGSPLRPRATCFRGCSIRRRRTGTACR